MYRRLLVPLDGSILSEQALPMACQLARRSGAALRLVHVHRSAAPDPLYVEGVSVIDEHLRSRAEEHERTYLERTCAQIGDAYGVASSYTSLSGDEPIATLLVQEAEAWNADLIVMTTHGRSGLAHMWLGSVADALIRVSPRPVLLMRPDEATTEAAPPTIETIVVPLDGSPFAEQILDPALELGQALGAAITLLYVVEPQALLHRDDMYIAPVDLNPEGTRRHQAAAQKYLERIARAVAHADQPISARVVLGEQVATAILETVDRQPNSMLALATHARSGIRRLFLGSVADKVVRGTHRPVLVYRPKSEPSAEQDD